jgi:hypothetical protein
MQGMKPKKATMLSSKDKKGYDADAKNSKF